MWRMTIRSQSARLRGLLHSKGREGSWSGLGEWNACHPAKPTCRDSAGRVRNNKVDRYEFHKCLIGTSMRLLRTAIQARRLADQIPCGSSANWTRSEAPKFCPDRA